MIVQPALFFHRQETVAIPLVTRLARGARAFQIERRRAVERHHLHAVFDRIDLHAPIAGVRGRVKVAIIHQRFQIETRCCCWPRTSVYSTIRRVLTMLIHTRFSSSASASA